MIPATFDYHAPKALDEALALLARLGDKAKILAGGQSLIPAMRFRLAVPEVLVDLSRLSRRRSRRPRGRPRSRRPGSRGRAARRPGCRRRA